MTNKSAEKPDELSGKVQRLDAAGKNLESDILQVRQKAAGEIDLLMRQARAENGFGTKPNPKSRKINSAMERGN